MKIQLFVDDETEPRATLDPPAPFDLDTTSLADGVHVLRVHTVEDSGPAGVSEIPFTVRNGPGIAVVGLVEGETVQDHVSLLINAYSSRAGDVFEPYRAETPAPTPTWAWVLCLLVAAWAMWYAASEYRHHADTLAESAPSTVETATAPMTAVADMEAEWKALGAQVYGNYCSACHQLGGAGVAGASPPLKADPVVTAEDPTEHIRIVLQGLQGKAIDGVSYSSPMPPFGNQLTDQQIAAVVNHERTNWGNAAPTISPDDVAAQR